MLAGGGVRGGQVVGRSDSQGAVPADNPVHASDFLATMYYALGYGADHVTFTPRVVIQLEMAASAAAILSSSDPAPGI